MIDLAMIDDFPQGVGHDLGLRLSGLCREAEERKDKSFSITEENHETLAASASIPQTYSGYYDRIVNVIARRAGFPGREAMVSLGELGALSYLPCQSLAPILSELASDGVLQVTSSAPGAKPGEKIQIKPTSKLWARADQISRESVGHRAFVAMAFAADLDEIYRGGFAAALTAVGYEPPFRVDDPEHDLSRNDAGYKRRIDDRILAEIRRARFVVADATHGRPNVYYEAGFADGLGKPVVWCCRSGEEQKLPFDTRQHEHIVWTDGSDLKTKLVAKIERYGWALKTRSKG